MTLNTDQKYQEKVEAAVKTICQLKQTDHLNKDNDKIAIPYVEEFVCVSIYPLLEYIVFDTYISDGDVKKRAATILGDIFHLHQCTKNTLKYVHTNSKYGHIVLIPDSHAQESFSRSASYKGWDDKILLHLSS